MKASLVYASSYDMYFPGFSWLHPFDGRKFSRAWKTIEARAGEAATRARIQPEAPVSDESLLRVHTRAYLDSLGSSAVVARALEAGPLRFLPNGLLRWRLLTPMRWAVAGTILALSRALADGGVSMNLGGGFHHAFPDHGEGFCLFADAAVAIMELRARKLLAPGDRVAVIDLDAHRGNGFDACLGKDADVRILDLYNVQAYPGPGEKVPYAVPLRAGLGDAEYLERAREELASFLDQAGPFRLALYNAGTDIVRGDRVGQLDVSPEGVRERDRHVVDTLSKRGIPAAIVTSGGYTSLSHALIAELALHLLTA
ncbi:MAG TPA: histone deacetylase [Planctomycetota bacterium]